MECFVHEGKPAVALCRTCGKGVCRSCALPVTRGVICSEACRGFAEDFAQLQVQSIRSIRTMKAQVYAQPLVGLVALGYGLYAFLLENWGTAGIFIAAMGGAVTLAWALGRRKFK